MVIITVLLVTYLVVTVVLLLTMYLLRLAYWRRGARSVQAPGFTFVQVAVLWPILMVVLLWVYLGWLMKGNSNG